MDGISDLWERINRIQLDNGMQMGLRTMNQKRLGLHMLSTRFHSWRYVLYTDFF